MAIPINQLRLIVKDTILALVNGHSVIRSTYQIVATDAIIAEITLDARIDRFDEFEEADAETFARAQSWFASIKEWHRPQDALDELSFHDASLILKNWAFSKPGNLWVILHPVSGEFTGLKVPVKHSRPTLKGRVQTVVSQIPPPSTWSWASSDTIETLDVKCVEVEGADSYNVYSDQGGGKYELLGNVPNHNSNSISVPGGYYRIRVAPVRSGVVGVMGNETQVQVEGGGVPAAPEMDETILFSVEPESTPEKKNKLLEWLRSFKRD